MGPFTPRSATAGSDGSSTRLSTTTRLLHRSPGNSFTACLNARTRHVCALVARTVPRRVKGALVSNSSETAYVVTVQRGGPLNHPTIFPARRTRRDSRIVARPRINVNLMLERRSTANVRRNASVGVPRGELTVLGLQETAAGIRREPLPTVSRSRSRNRERTPAGRSLAAIGRRRCVREPRAMTV